MAAIQLTAFDLAEAVTEHSQRPLCGNTGIQLPQTARRRVAWIGKCLFTPLPGFLVEPFKTVDGHVHFAAHLQHSWPATAAQSQGNRRDSAHILGDILPALAVTAGGSPHQQALLVAQANRESVQFGFRRIAHLSVEGQPLTDPAIEIRQFVFGKSIGQRQHGQCVRYFVECVQGPGTHPLGGRIRTDQAGKVRFQLLQLAQQPVVFAVGD